MAQAARPWASSFMTCRGVVVEGGVPAVGVDKDVGVDGDHRAVALVEPASDLLPAAVA